MDNTPPHHSNYTLVTLAEVVERNSDRLSDRTSFEFTDDEGRCQSLTYAELAARARTLGGWLAARVPVSDRALLVYPPGLEFITAFLGCLYAGVVPVPSTYPKPRRPMPRLDSIAADCAPSLALTHSSVINGLCLDDQSVAISAIAWEATDQIPTLAKATFEPLPRTADDLAFLQYTSGSTSQPRGVMVTHGNLIHNLTAIRESFGIEPGSHANAVFWLPAYHDMGLIGGILAPLFLEGTSTLMAPATFLRRPQRWLELIASTRAAISGSPNFGYELAARKTTPAERASLDLSHWRLAFCGAEPINHATLSEFAGTFAVSGFRPRAFFPCYGLAESTLLVTGGQQPTGPRMLTVDRQAIQDHRVVVAETESASKTTTLVGCGPVCSGLEVQIVHPQSQKLCAPDEIGEIWVSGPSVAPGYWSKDVENAATFRARITSGDAEDTLYLRTGDLGFQYGGELFITGRLKDVIVIRGRNHYPQDLERTALAAHEAVDIGAAFSIEVAGREELVLVHQKRRACHNADHNQVIHAIRSAIVAEHEIDPHAIVLIRPVSLPVTSSGKVQRSRCRDLYLADELAVTAEWINPHRDEELSAIPNDTLAPEFLSRLAQLSPDQLRTELESWLIDWLTIRAQLMPGTLLPGTPFAQLGIDSLTAVEISHDLDQLLDLNSPPMVIWSCPTPETLADFLAAELQATQVS